MNLRLANSELIEEHFFLIKTNKQKQQKNSRHELVTEKCNKRAQHYLIYTPAFSDINQQK